VVARATGGAGKMDKADQVALAMSYQRISQRDMMTLEDIWV
jgi:predicted Zn-dependent protease